MSKSILVHIELLKEEKQIKTYLEELLELEGLLYKHLQQLDKVSTVIDNVLNNVEFNKQQLKFNANQNERLELVRQTIAITEKASFEERNSKKVTGRKNKKVTSTSSGIETSKKVKAAKPDTKELSFALYKEGKTIFEIAEARGFAITTIEGHLAHYVSLGMIPVSQFVAKEKFDVIMEHLELVSYHLSQLLHMFSLFQLHHQI